MRIRVFGWAQIILALGCLILATTGEVQCQSSSKEALIEAIQEKAARDVEQERPPADAQDLNILYGKDAEREMLSLHDVMKIYGDAYSKEKAKKPWWSPFKPTFGWIIAIILFLLLIFRDAIRDTINPRLKAIGDKLYNRVAGYRVFQRKALKKYHKAIVKKYQEFRMPFRSDRTLDMHRVYVPMKVKGMNDVAQVDDLSAIDTYKRLVVVGAPGSGKSMLLRRIALSYAVDRLNGLTRKEIPVLLDLRRLNKESKPIPDHIVDVFGLNDFPEAKNFIQLSLEQGRLLLLFDGLDEVNSTKREEEVNKLRDLLDKYEECRAIITCRTAVYRSEFDDIVNQTLEIVDFTDQQIQRFLNAWPHVPAGKSIDQLMLALRERPRIMALARNPLLLTIIAFLYTDMEEFVLPHSRTEFYTQAVDMLLRQWKVEQNYYTVNHKLLVLEQLALYNQETGSQAKDDRLTLDVKTVIKEVNKALPDLNLEPKDATPLLKEIVERSGLLLEIDNKTRYQFSHLTLQEYFTASALRNDPKRLLDYFQKDPDAWRETIKLWCGLPHDSTQFISEVYKLDPVTGFECLADAQKVDQAVANAIVDSFKTSLDKADEKGDAIIRAFAAVASGPSQRSQTVFNFLVDMLATPNKEAVRMAAATSLSHTNKPAAVRVLAAHFKDDRSILSALARMGDLAVAELSAQARSGYTPALEALYLIGTPQAAQALVSLLWAEKTVAIDAAFYVGSLLQQENIEATLASYPITDELRSDNWYKWVWKPFETDSPSALPVISGRIAWLLELGALSERRTPVATLDRRIVIPLSVYIQNQMKATDKDLQRSLSSDQILALFSINRSLIWKLEGPIFDLRTKGERFGSLRENLEFLHSVLVRGTTAQQRISIEADTAPADQRWERVPDNPHPLFRLCSFLNTVPQFDMIARLLRKPPPNVGHWENLLQFNNYVFVESWYYKVILTLLSIVAVSSLLEIILTLVHAPAWHSVFNILLIIQGLVTIFLFGGFMSFSKKDEEIFNLFFGGFVSFPYMIFTADMRRPKNIFDAIGQVVVMIYLIVLTPLLLVLTTLLMLRALPVTYVVVVMGFTVALALACYARAKLMERRGKNPLRGILDVPHNESDLLDLKRGSQETDATDNTLTQAIPSDESARIS